MNDSIINQNNINKIINLNHPLLIKQYYFKSLIISM